MGILKHSFSLKRSITQI